MHEASLYENNAFITLTSEDAFLYRRYRTVDARGREVMSGSLDRRAFPLFMKRLRQEVGPVRYFHSGEYGEENGRPHYHALLFGVWFRDTREVGTTASGHPAFASDTLSWLWPDGVHQIGAVSFESAQYVARYCLKKVTGVGAQAHYQRVGPDGKLFQLEPEYATMSRGNGIPGDPGQFGIGYRWLEKFRGEVYRDDAVMRGGVEMTPPRYYDKKESEVCPTRMAELKERRSVEMQTALVEQYRKGLVSRLTLPAREAITLSRLEQGR